MDWVAASFRPGQVLFSLMSQYTPQPGAEGLLSRRVTGGEYRAALAYMENLGILDGYRQDSSSAKEEYTPAFHILPCSTPPAPAGALPGPPVWRGHRAWGSPD